MGAVTRHRRTDPACSQHREPRTHWQQWRYDRARGYSCPVCMPGPPPLPPDRSAAPADGTGLARFAQSREGGETYIPFDYAVSRMRILRMTELRLGLIPECQPMSRSVQTYVDREPPKPEITGYLLTCQTCGAERTTDQPGRLAHLEHQPD